MKEAGRLIPTICFSLVLMRNAGGGWTVGASDETPPQRLSLALHAGCAQWGYQLSLTAGRRKLMQNILTE
jgi:hypothetical protein